MPMLTLEPAAKTSPARLGKIAFTAVAAVVVLFLFVGPLIVRHDYGSLSSGERVNTVFAGFGFVEATDAEKQTVTIRTETDGRIVTVPANQVTEL